MSRGLGINVALRKVTTGYRVTGFQTDDLNHAYSMAVILVRSPEYGRCYAVGTDFQNNQVFSVYPEQVQQPAAPYTPQMQRGYPQQQAYYQPQAAPAWTPVPALPSFDEPASQVYDQSGRPLLGRGAR